MGSPLQKSSTADSSFLTIICPQPIILTKKKEKHQKTLII